MALKEAWEIRRSRMPAPLKYIALALAMMWNPKRCGHIFISVEELARDLGLNRVTVSRRLTILAKLGVFPVVRRGGRYRNARSGQVTAWTSRRRYDAAALATLDQAFAPRMGNATWSPDQIAKRLLGVSDHVWERLLDAGGPCSAQATVKETSTSKKLERSPKETTTREDSAKQAQRLTNGAAPQPTLLRAALNGKRTDVPHFNDNATFGVLEEIYGDDEA